MKELIEELRDKLNDWAISEKNLSKEHQDLGHEQAAWKASGCAFAYDFVKHRLDAILNECERPEG